MNREQLTDKLVYLADGNPGAITALVALTKSESVDGVSAALKLDELGWRGPQIWVAYKDVCRGDVLDFAKRINEKCSVMIETVDKEMRGEGPSRDEVDAELFQRGIRNL